MTRMKTMLLAAGALLMAGGGVAAAQMGGPGGGPGFHHPGMELFAGVTLSDAQKAQLHQIVQATREQNHGTWERMHQLHEQLAAKLLSPGTVTADDLAPIAQEEAQLRGQMEAQRLQTVVQMRNVLTPEQLAQAASAHTKLEALHAQMRAVIHPDQGAGTAEQ